VAEARFVAVRNVRAEALTYLEAKTLLEATTPIHQTLPKAHSPFGQSGAAEAVPLRDRD
jgi:hypothetical protein